MSHKQDGEKVRIAEFASADEEARWIAMEIEPVASRRATLAVVRGALPHPFPSGSFGRGDRGARHSVCHSQSFDSESPSGARFDRLREAARKPSGTTSLARACWRLRLGGSNRPICRCFASAPPKLKNRFGTCCNRRKASWRLREKGGAPTNWSPDSRNYGAANGASRPSNYSTRSSEWLELSLVTRPGDRPYLDRLRQFVREWQLKSETSRLREFAEYLEYFEQAGGKIDLEQEGGDAVQLMTVHAAKGLEFDHVFVLRLAQRAFPMAPRPSVLEFPAALMKEELPQGDFHMQEERRLFYVAITRARDRLTLTTVVHKRSKPSVFLDDILSAPSFARQTIEQSAPKLPPAPQSAEPESASPLFDETIGKPRVYSRIGEWALAYRPPVFEPLQLSASAIDTYNTCPQKYLFGKVWGIPGGPAAATTFGNVMHTTIRQFVGMLRKGQRPPFEEVETIFRREWTSAGFEDKYQEEMYQHDGIEQLRSFYASALAAPPDVFAQEKGFYARSRSWSAGHRATGSD